jgi:hypothetical protein
MKFRYHPARGLRIQGRSYGEIDGTEIESEEYETLEDFLEAVEQVNRAIVEIILEIYEDERGYIRPKVKYEED